MIWSRLCCVPILCVSSSCQSEGHVDEGRWRCGFSRALPPSFSGLPIEHLSCECMESWGKGGENTPHMPLGCGPLRRALGALGCLCLGIKPPCCFCCLSRCQNSVLLRGLNFWKPIKMCLLWVGSRDSGCRPLSLCLVFPSLPLEHMGPDLSGPGYGKGGWVSLAVPCVPPVELISVKGLAKLPLLL